jgi:hypothetical protein
VMLILMLLLVIWVVLLREPTRVEKRIIRLMLLGLLLRRLLRHSQTERKKIWSSRGYGTERIFGTQIRWQKWAVA